MPLVCIQDGINGFAKKLLTLLIIISNAISSNIFAFMDAYLYLLIIITGVLIACLGMELTHTTFMIRTKLAKLHISHIRLHSASSVRILSSVDNFRHMLPTIRLFSLGSPIIRK